MKLIYSREGGLFPQVAETEVTIADLPADLQTLASDVLTNPKAYSSRSTSATRNLRDGYQYRLDLQDGNKKVSLSFDDLSQPESIQPLIQFLQQRTGKS